MPVAQSVSCNNQLDWPAAIMAQTLANFHECARVPKTEAQLGYKRLIQL
jgi:hypothetical protein